MSKSLYNASLTDIIPDVLAAEPESQAFAYALQQQVRKCIAYADGLKMYSDIDNQSDEVIDIMAAELKTQFYDATFPRQVKIDMVKGTIEYYLKAGTKQALVDIVRNVYGKSDLIEWNEYGGEEGYFKLKLDISDLKQRLDVANLIGIINAHKRLSAWLDEIAIGSDSTIKVGVDYEKYKYDLPISGITECGADPWGEGA